jgi:hypothetical protein
MRKLLPLAVVLFAALFTYGQGKVKPSVTKAVKTNAILLPAQVPAELQGGWMYGNFSMTEYWSTSPATYLGNALTFAIAFKFNPDGTYEQYFTSSSVMGGINTYHQSVTKGKVKIDSAAKTIITYPAASHYKRTRMGKVEEDRDMLPKEISGASTYVYKPGKEPSGTKAIYLTLQGTNNPLTFLKKF